jgi:hypothetical protein
VNAPNTIATGGFDWDRPLDRAERDTILTKIAESVVKRGMQTPAVWFLEVHKPLAPLGSQLAVALSPFIAVWLADGAFDLQKCFQILRDTKNIDLLVKMIEDRSLVKEK